MPIGNNRRIHIATSGRHYDRWRGPFYPEDLQKKDFLSCYSRRFSTVEINSTFYGLPEEKTLKDWFRAAPEGFIFSIKASRFITHNKKLSGCSKSPICGVNEPTGAKKALRHQTLKDRRSSLRRTEKYAFPLQLKIRNGSPASLLDSLHLEPFEQPYEITLRLKSPRRFQNAKNEFGVFQQPAKGPAPHAPAVSGQD